MKKIILLFTSILFMQSAYAQWVSFIGSATEISCGSASQLASISGPSPGDRSVYKYNFSTNVWDLMTGATSTNYNKVSIANDGTIWARNIQGMGLNSNLIKFNAPAVAGDYNIITGQLDNISVASSSSAIGSVSNTNNNINQITSTSNTFSNLPGSTLFSAKKVVIAGNGDVMAINQANSGNNIFRFISGAWVAVPSTTVINATDIAIGQDNSKMAAIAGGELYVYNNGAWFLDQTAPTSLAKVTISAGADATMYILTTAANNNIRTNNLTTILCGGIPPVPTNTTVASALNICAGNTTTLTASGSGTLKWYASPTSTALLGTGTSFITPSISQNTTFYVANDTGTCESARVAININVTPTPAAPTNTTPTANMTKCSGNVTSLSVSGGSNNSWYANDSIGTALATANSFTTPVLFTTTTYYVGGVSSVNSQCVSPRIPITVTVSGPNPGTLSGNQNVCIGSTTTFIPTASGGTWSSLNTGVATVNASGVVTGVSAGTTTIIFRFTGASGCPNVVTTRDVTVTSAISAGTLSGVQSICLPGTSTFSSTVSGGTWSSSNTALATVNISTGVVTGVSQGSAVITYTVTGGGCGNVTATRTVQVYSAITAGTLSGTQSICPNSTTPFSSTVSGGTWTSSNNNIASVNANGIITGAAAGTATITYSVAGVGTCTGASATRTITVKQATSSARNQTICQGSSYSFKGQILRSAGTYRDTITNAVGCDSIIALTLTVTPAIQRQLSESICFGASYSYKGQSLTQAGTYSDTTQTAAGCDSITTLTLSVRNRAQKTINAQVCTGQSYSFKGQSLTQSGTYLDTVQTTNGCDSFITLNLSVNSFVTGTTTKVICQGESFTFNGQSLTQAGQYLDTLTSVGGCDSILTLTLTVNSLPTPTISKTGVSLSTQVFASYQWKLNGNNITGATSQNYTATTNGSYTVEVIDANGCKNTSSAAQVTGLSIDNTRLSDIRFEVYPNPADEVLNIEVETKEFTLIVTDIAGRKMMVASNQKVITLSALASGVYNIEIKTENGIARKQFIKK